MATFQHSRYPYKATPTKDHPIYQAWFQMHSNTKMLLNFLHILYKAIFFIEEGYCTAIVILFLLSYFCVSSSQIRATTKIVHCNFHYILHLKINIFENTTPFQFSFDFNKDLHQQVHILCSCLWLFSNSILNHFCF